jgi:hypothetical protein
MQESQHQPPVQDAPQRVAIHEKRFLFLLCPPLSGSTLIKELIEASPAVSAFPTEGQFLPGLESVLGRPDRWDSSIGVDWGRVRQVFFDNWDLTRPILFEKSPPHLVRAEQVAGHFQPSSFLISIRDPYAQIEGLLRRGWHTSPRAAALFWLECAQQQRRNIATLPRNYFFSYEELCERPAVVLRHIEAFMPGIGPLDPNRTHQAHNVTGRPIHGLRNLNELKISKLPNTDIAQITNVLAEDMTTLRHFGYRLRA